MKILILDDSIMLRAMLKDALMSGGYSDIVEAQDGIIGLDKAKQINFDLIITDVNMPNMDGLTFIKELRQLKSYSDTPVLVLTTERGDIIKKQGKEAGASGWIIKPFVEEQLLQAVKIVLSKNK